MKIKPILMTLFIALFLVFLWQSQSNANLSNPLLKTGKLQYYDILLINNNSAFGFSSIQAYVLFFIAPFLILLNMFFTKEDKWLITRFKSRQQFYFLRIRQIIYVAFVFSALHSVVNVVQTYSNFPLYVLEENNFMEIAFLNTISLTLFYSLVGVLYEMIKDVSNSSTLSFFIVIFSFGALFFFEKLIFSEIWGPLKDLTMYNKMLEQDWGYLDASLVLIRQFFFAAFATNIGATIFVRKDMYK